MTAKVRRKNGRKEKKIVYFVQMLKIDNVLDRIDNPVRRIMVIFAEILIIQNYFCL